MTKAYIGLGANLGDPPRQLRRALEYLAATPEIELGAVSRFYRSAPIGPPGQPDYCNAVCAVETTRSADALLGRLQDIEARMGRVRGARWGPRMIDLDLLWMEGHSINSRLLTLPHPRLHLRAFVLVPLAEIAADLELPGLGPVEVLAAKVDRSGLVRPEADAG